MNEPTHGTAHSYRARAQSLFSYRPRVSTDLTIALLERWISSQSSTSATNGTAVSSSDECQIIVPNRTRRAVFFVCQPFVAGLLIFPLLILFWQSGWNFMDFWLSHPTEKHGTVLVLLYALAQGIFLLIYMNQDHLYDYLRQRKTPLVVRLILQVHTGISASTYILQWVSMWTLWDRYTSDDWLLMLVVSIAALLALIALMGHPCDLVCAPFILSYDSIEYNIRIGSPFRTDKMNDSLAHFLNYILYEFLISLLSILAWRGSYTLLDVFLYPKDPSMSAGSSLLLGYPLYFLLMYTQAYSDQVCIAPTFVYFNYAALVHNVRHLTAFYSCVLLWRGFWLLFDTHIATVPLALTSPYLFYLLCMFVSFTALSLLRTASSINGPMSQMYDHYDLFPHYPNCYLFELFSSKKRSSSGKITTQPEPNTIAFLE